MDNDFGDDVPGVTVDVVFKKVVEQAITSNAEFGSQDQACTSSFGSLDGVDDAVAGRWLISSSAGDISLAEVSVAVRARMDESGVVRVVRAALSQQMRPLTGCHRSPAPTGSTAMLRGYTFVSCWHIAWGVVCVCVCWGIGVKLDYCIYIQVRYNVWSADVVDVRSEAASETPEAQIKRSCLSSYQIIRRRWDQRGLSRARTRSGSSL